MFQGWILDLEILTIKSKILSLQYNYKAPEDSCLSGDSAAFVLSIRPRKTNIILTVGISVRLRRLVWPPEGIIPSLKSELMLWMTQKFENMVQVLSDKKKRKVSPWKLCSCHLVMQSEDRSNYSHNHLQAQLNW